MTSITRGIPKRGRRFSLLVFAVVVGTFSLVTLECDCFPLRPTTVDKKRGRRQFVSAFRPSRSKGVSANTYCIAETSLKSDNVDDDSDEMETESKSLMELLSPASSCRVTQMSGTDLAYIGDSVFELFIRSRHVWPSKRTSDLQNIVVGIVRGTSFDR